MRDKAPREQLHSVCHIHAGMSHAGGPLIRFALKDSGKLAGFHFLQIGEGRQPRDLVTAFSSAPEKLPYLCKKFSSPEEILRHAQSIRRGIESGIHAAAGRSVIMVEETLPTMPVEELMALRDFLASRFQSIRLVVHLRAPSASMACEFQKRLLGPKLPVPMGKLFPRYHGQLEKLDSVFGRDAVIVRKCDSPQQGMEDFFQLLGVPSPSGGVREATQVLSLEATALMFAFRKFSGVPADVKRDRMLMRELRRFGKGVFEIPADVRKRVLDRQSAGMAWVDSRLGGRLEEELPAAVPPSVASLTDLLALSVTAAHKLIAQKPGGFTTSIPQPHTPREAAQVVKDFANSLHGTVEPRAGSRKDAVCYVHVGMAKTGTTSIQHALRSCGSDPSFVYLDIGPPNHGRMIFSLFAKSPERHPYYRKIGWPIEKVHRYVLKMRAAFENALAANGSRRFIISGEAITMLKKEELTDFKAFLDRFFGRVQIVAYVRDPKSYMESIFQQRLKGYALPKEFSNVYPSYVRKLRKFDQVFGADHLIFRKFDPASFPQRDVVLDFCRLLEITLAGYQSTRRNESLPLEAVALLYAFRTYGGKLGAGRLAMTRNKEMIEALGQLEGAKLSISYRKVEEVVHERREDLEWLEKRTGMSFGKIPSIDVTDSVETLDALLAHSMEGARKLITRFGHRFKTSEPRPETPQQAAKVLSDFALTLGRDID